MRNLAAATWDGRIRLDMAQREASWQQHARGVLVPQTAIELQGAEAAYLVEAFIRWSVRRAAPSVGCVSAAGWLSVLRRMDLSVFAAVDTVTPWLKLRTAERLTAGSGRDAMFDYLRHRPAAVCHDDYRYRALVDVLTAADRIAVLEALRRRVSKGQRVEIGGSVMFPRPVAEHPLESLIVEHDARRERLGTRWHQLLDFTVPKDRLPYLVPLVTPDLTTGDDTGAEPPRRPGVQRYLNYPVVLGSRASDSTIVETGRLAADADYMAALVVLARATGFAATDGGNGLGTLSQTGYFAIEHCSLHAYLDFALEVARSETSDTVLSPYALATASEVMRVLCMRRRGDLDMAPALREAGSNWLIDMASLSDQIQRLFGIDRSGGGQAVNVVARGFELDVQRAVDHSPRFRPETRYRELRGRDLRVGGEVVTDIDAIFQRGDRLFLVSCKAFEHSAGYDAGMFQPVRRAMSSLARAFDEWEEKVDRLRSVRLGQNFDFRDRKLHGIVVTPDLLFTSHPYSRVRDLGGVEGLRSYMAAEELFQVLDGATGGKANRP